MMEAVNKAFLEDKEMIEGQHQAIKENPHAKMVPTVHDAALSQLRWLSERLLKEDLTENPV
jgi:hypothetical protein